MEFSTVLSNISAAIQAKEEQKVIDNLELLPLNDPRIPNIQILKLTEDMLRECQSTNDSQIARAIIDTMDMFRLNISEYPLILLFVTNSEINYEIRKFALTAYHEKDATDYFLDIINANGAKDTLNMAFKLTDLISAQMNNDDWNHIIYLMNTGQDEDTFIDEKLLEYFKEKAKETGGNRGKCTWTKCYPKLDLPIVPKFPSVGEAVDMILSKMDSLDIVAPGSQHDDLRDGLISQYCISMLSEKCQLLNHAGYKIECNDIPIFREYGPVNTLYNSSSDSLPDDHKCAKLGGCRMLSCTCFERSDQEDEIVEKWFYGSCDICKVIIEKEEYAFRLPLDQGGWIGCYCHGDCAKPDIQNNYQAILFGRVIEQLETIGIRNKD